ncbi:MAG: hypothetical protein QMC85_07675 [Methanocellales archaeon]|nr:hypothetical protein [Methanocellales archaeon]
MAIVRAQEVIDSWSILVEGAQGRADEIFTNTNNRIAETKAPNVKVERKAMAPGIIRGLFGTKRDFLIVTEKGNPRLKPYQMFIGARDYGNNLDISWYLTHRPSFWLKLMAFLLFIPGINFFVLPFALIGGLSSMVKERRGGLDLDLFDQQDLVAYATNTHHCLLEGVERLLIELKQDPAKIDRKSKGFLGIS